MLHRALARLADLDLGEATTEAFLSANAARTFQLSPPHDATNRLPIP